MSKRSIRVFSREFKLEVVRRMLAGENVSVLARELKVLRKDLYAWRKRFRTGGPEALRGRDGRDALSPESRPPSQPADAAPPEIISSAATPPPPLPPLVW